MIILDATTKTVEVLLAGAVATTQLPIVASYVDVSSTTYVPGESDTATNNTTAVTAVAAPGAGNQRHVKLLTVHNADTVTATAIIRYNNNGTTRILARAGLAINETYQYSDGDGWRVVPGVTPGLANPSATIGLTAVNGTATTALRSDGAPALSQAIVPTWSAAHTFSELIAASKGVSFPATQVASAGANDLDDYEEGTWTPVIGGGTSESGQTYTVQTGRYVKIGQLVCCSYVVVLSNKGTITGNLRLKGLPFTAENVENVPNAAGYWGNMTTAVVWMSANVILNSTGADIYLATGATTTLTAGVAADISNTTNLFGECFYRATA